MRVFVIRVVLVFFGIVSAGCLQSPIRGYEGGTLPKDQSAIVRVVGPGRIEMEAPGYMLIEVQIDNPVSGEPANSRFVSSVDKSPWLEIPAMHQCLVFRSRPTRCPPAFEELVAILGSIEGGCQSVSGNVWAEQEACFEPLGRREYEVRVTASVSNNCIGGIEVSGFELVDRDTGESMTELGINGSCIPSGSLTE